ncbi:soluble quino protein glucose/sorbosone dehydrogenase [Lineolata rhizophorae]|uniref:Soluble quino protein glucose/sorbosone dehydrogenase n=1 Tax=Lineolata rhizophorae TaxID=578093 RepID=A0A6A6P5F9_9PEZI|nr:soluble quino protein glucose/sorbosone dehydrogenase [Lineolata rhizophorae]
MLFNSVAFTALVGGFLPQVIAQSCPTINPTAGQPQMSSGYQTRVFTNGLSSPRTIVFDTEGNMLVVEQGGGGVRRITLRDNGGLDVCPDQSTTIIPDASLNHGLDLSQDGRTLFVSSMSEVYAYSYDPSTGQVGSSTTIVTGMTQGGHQTRTLLASKFVNGTLLVSRGSDDNLDDQAVDENSGHSFIKSFSVDPLPSSPYDYASDGETIGWGLRNSVGMGENPYDGGFWSVDNGVDNMMRNGQDIHTNNPAEELNYHGIITDESDPQRGLNFGYPDCYAAWDVNTIPNNQGMEVGAQFLIDNPFVSSMSDNICQTQREGPRLSFAAHTAPLDVTFRADGSAAYISFHGSWNREPADGFRVGRVDFEDGQPVPSANTQDNIEYIMQNSNLQMCPYSCFRPVGLTFDNDGRLWMASDSSGEIYVITGA